MRHWFDFDDILYYIIMILCVIGFAIAIILGGLAIYGFATNLALS